MRDDFTQAVADHDEALRRRDLDIWLGGEPTFTDRFSSDPAWNGGALGGDKRERGARVAGAMATARPGSAFLRTLGRTYPGESTPRWSFGVYARRDREPVWNGPPDPFLGGTTGTEDHARSLRDLLHQKLGGLCFEVDGPLAYRLAVAAPTAELPAEPSLEPLLARPPLGSVDMPADGPHDRLAERGISLISIGLEEECVRVELPAISSVDEWLRWLADVAAAARDAAIGGLVISGFPPPVDRSIWWTTATPDPGVLEINMAPEASLAGYHAGIREAHELAEQEGLSCLRYYYNGDVTESGGGGHITLGGPSPERSPWLLEPRMLPRLIAYLNRHPSLSFLFAPDSIGSSGQCPRPDEVPREMFDGMTLAVEQLGGRGATSPEDLWKSFAPLLADRFGNTHRCEINVEKLWNPWLPLRGQLGVVELRGHRMARSPERAVATAALFRAVAAYAATVDLPLAMTDWGAELHDRFALPWFLFEDLRDVFGDLASAGLGLGDVLESELLDDDHLVIGEVALPGARLSIRRALEFWPLVGDVTQDQETSRTIDASCARVELALSGELADHCTLAVAGHQLPRATDGTDGNGARVLGVRFRRFVPSNGLHPLLPALDPLEITVAHPDEGSVRACLYNWIPGGGLYEGVPQTDAAALERRRERLQIEHGVAPLSSLPVAPARALTSHCFDTRRLFVPL